MFTGLVEARGTVVERSAARLVVRAPFGGVVRGESIAVDGVCLTALPSAGARARGDVFEADVSPETLARTTLGGLRAGARVNLERSVPLGGRMGGHIVSGHVDGVGAVVEKTPIAGATKMVFRAPAELLRFIAPKGSIAVSGVSLTVNGVSGDRFDVVIVPHTEDVTGTASLAVGALVNLEVDLLARYVARLMETRGDAQSGEKPSSLEGALARAGYPGPPRLRGEEI